jgi:SRSO17 transposase
VSALRPCFARVQTWLQAGKYLNALASDLPSRNGWSIGEQCGDRSPGRTQRLLSRASWDEDAAMSQVRRHAAAGLDKAARRCRRNRMTVGALDETGQEKHGSLTAGVKRQYMGCAGRVANGINTVHLSYVRDKTGHALIGARQWIPQEQVIDPVQSLVTGLPPDLRFRTKGQLAIDVLGDAYADGLSFDFACGDEVYGSCTELRRYLEDRGQAYVLRVASSFTLAFAAGITMTCADAVKKLLRGKKAWEVRSAGKGSKGERWYARAWLSTGSPRHSLLVRRHLKSGELAFHYCFTPEGHRPVKARLIRAARLRWPVEECFESGKDYLGLDQCQARLYTAIRRHLVLAWPPSRSAPSPPPGSGTPLTPTPRPRRPQTRSRQPTPASSRSPSTRSRTCSPPPSASPGTHGTPPAGFNGDAATRHDPAGSTSAHASHATTPRSTSDWRLRTRRSR